MRFLMQKPILGLGIVMFSLFLYQVSRDKKWGVFHNEKFNTTSCQAVVIKLKKHIPENWDIFCEGNNLAVIIEEKTIPRNASNLKSLLYRQLVNHMTYVAKKSHVDILEKVFFTRFKLNHPRMVINAITEGKFIVKLATLTSSDHIMAHLQSTVQVKEERK